MALSLSLFSCNKAEMNQTDRSTNTQKKATSIIDYEESNDHVYESDGDYEGGSVGSNADDGYESDTVPGNQETKTPSPTPPAANPASPSLGAANQTPAPTPEPAPAPAEVGTLKPGGWNLTFRHLDPSSIGLTNEGMDFGIAKALNSVSQVAEVRKVPPLEGGLSYSIDPNDFGFTANQKQAIQNCSHLRKTDIDGTSFMEADTFMYCILEPRIYYRLMNIQNAGNMELAVERRYLRTQRSVQNRQVVCVRKSDVANGADRMMERIQRPDGGVFWGTADYLNRANGAAAINSGTFPPSNSNRVNLLKAGEFMWEMPNGFIGYALSGFGAQARFEANRQVASDPGRNDQYVIAGYGCFACHTSGFNTGNWIPCGQGPNATFPDAQGFAQLIQKDNTRFLAAMKKMGTSDEIIQGPEPITAIIKNFESRTGTAFQPAGATGAIGF